STRSTSCVTAAASVWARRSSGRGVRFTSASASRSDAVQSPVKAHSKKVAVYLRDHRVDLLGNKALDGRQLLFHDDFIAGHGEVGPLRPIPTILKSALGYRDIGIAP